MSDIQTIFLMSAIMLHAGLCAPDPVAKNFGGFSGIALLVIGMFVTVIS